MPDDETQLRTLARFPRENPSPVFRISRSGTIDYANDAGLPLLETIASGHYRDDARARVRRTGERIATVFEPFRQADESASREAGGMGLGLAITQSLCEKMHGSVSVTSQQNEGTTCVVSLPVEPPCP